MRSELAFLTRCMENASASTTRLESTVRGVYHYTMMLRGNLEMVTRDRLMHAKVSDDLSGAGLH